MPPITTRPRPRLSNSASTSPAKQSKVSWLVTKRQRLAVAPAIQGQQAHAGLRVKVFERLVDIAAQPVLKDERQARPEST